MIQNEREFISADGGNFFRVNMTKCVKNNGNYYRVLIRNNTARFEMNVITKKKKKKKERKMRKTNVPEVVR